MTTKTHPENAAQLLDGMPLATLVQAWEDTDRKMDALRSKATLRYPDHIEFDHLVTVRGWMQDAFERRNADAFNAWIDSNEDSPRGFFNA